MTARLIDMLLRLAPRERILLGLLVLVILPTGLWFGVLEPLAARRMQAQTALTEARALQDWVQGRSQVMAALGQAENTGPRPPIGLSALESSLIAAGLREAISGLANGAEDEIELRFDVVEFSVLMDWLSAQDPVWGYDIAAFRLAETEEPGLVAAQVRLRPQL
jgi:type II secretory pathway component PulM